MLSSLSVSTTATAITNKITTSFDKAFKTVDVTTLEKLLADLIKEGIKYTDTTVTAYDADIDARYKAAVDALTASPIPSLAKKKIIYDLKFPQMMAKYEIQDVFDDFQHIITEFHRNVLVRYSEITQQSQDDVLNNVQSRVNEISNRITDILQNFVKADEEDQKAVNDALRV